LASFSGSLAVRSRATDLSGSEGAACSGAFALPPRALLPVSDSIHIFVADMSDAKKTQRWIDLLAALLSHHYPVTFEELAKDVPAYDTTKIQGNKTKLASIKKMFERDKAELLEQGVPLISFSEPGEEEYKYQLRSNDFYLPYLGIAASRGLKLPPTVDRYGYRSLAKLGFEPDELEVVAEGARLVAQAGDPTLVDDTRSALRKLAFDLPLGATEVRDDQVIVQPRNRAEPGVLATLGDALFRRKLVAFRYHGIDAKLDTDRTCEPYGLFFLNGHWYLVARDTDKDALRNFRVSRMTNVQRNTKTPQSTDYTIPETFFLREHARSREAWEIGDGDTYEAIVEFRGKTGAAIAAAALGRAHPSSPSLRHFHVRRTDSFARWLLTFAGEAKPVAPDALLAAYSEIVEQTRALYPRESHD
jgi:proteasome accessory factor B